MKFGVREICDVVLRAKTAQKIGKKIFYKNEPVCYFDTLKTSTMEGAATTVYAQGGRGNARLMSWDGERTVTFTMEDALISPIGLSILTGAGLIEPTEGEPIIQHITETVKKQTPTGGTEGFYVTKKPHMTSDNRTIYAMILNDDGEVVSEPYLCTAAENSVTLDSGGEGYLLTLPGASINGYAGESGDADPKIALASKLLIDYYTARKNGAYQVNITADKFGGTFYLEASTLWRDQSTGKDLPAEFIIPSCKVQSNFTFSMSSSGDPSTFTFTMDAFPDYTRWDGLHKVLATIQIIGADESGLIEPIREQTWTSISIDDDGVVSEIVNKPEIKSVNYADTNLTITIDNKDSNNNRIFDYLNVDVYNSAGNKVCGEYGTIAVADAATLVLEDITLTPGNAYTIVSYGVKNNKKSATDRYSYTAPTI